MREVADKKNSRNSSIELIKIIAMGLIVLSHVTQTLYSENIHFSGDYAINVSHATTSISNLVLAWISASGVQGNDIFFICSAWFLIDSNSINFKKIFHMLADVWIINVTILIVFKIGAWYQLPIQDIIKSIFPTTFDLNWYVTCYIMFYLIHLPLNFVIKSCTQKQLLSINMVTLSLYCGINYLHGGHFYINGFIGFVVIYFAIAYIKLYMKKYCNSVKANIITLAIGIVGLPVLILLTNYLGLHFGVLENGLTRWGRNLSPFLLLVAVSMFNLAARKQYVCKTINNISSMTLLIYILHENYLFRTYVRPEIWIFINENIGYKYVVLIDLIFAACLFILATVLAFMYKYLFQRIVYKIADNTYAIVKKIYENICSLLLKLD